MTELLAASLAIVPSTIMALAYYKKAKAAEIRAVADLIRAWRAERTNEQLPRPLTGGKE